MIGNASHTNTALSVSYKIHAASRSSGTARNTSIEINN